MTLILDTTALIHCLFNPHDDLLNVIFESEIFAPDIIVSETGNVLWKFVRFKNLNTSLALERFQSGLDLISQIIPSDLIKVTSFELAVKHQISFYDSLYLTLAIELNSPLLTFDKKLNSISKKYKLNYRENNFKQ